jgi:CheY-like chemotaxis protein
MSLSNIPSVLAGKCVLVAEDDAIIAMLAETIIQDLGGKSAGSANSCETALAMLEQSKPDLVLLDIDLGGRSSERVLRAAMLQRVPVLISSGNGPETIPSAFRAYPLLSKPWTSDEFALAVEALFALTD